MAPVDFPWLSLVYVTLICGLPSVCVVFLFQSVRRFQVLATIFLLSHHLPSHWWGYRIRDNCWSPQRSPSVFNKAGKFWRDVNEPMYFHRRAYGLCWSASITMSRSPIFACHSPS
jgi:hypothetical protein